MILMRLSLIVVVYTKDFYFMDPPKVIRSTVTRDQTPNKSGHSLI